MTHDPASKSKPFPWRCPRCLEQSVQPATISHTAKRTNDGQVDVVEIPALTIPQCKKCGELLFTQNVDEQIQEAFRARRKVGAPVE